MLQQYNCVTPNKFALKKPSNSGHRQTPGNGAREWNPNQKNRSTNSSQNSARKNHRQTNKARDAWPMSKSNALLCRVQQKIFRRSRNDNRYENTIPECPETYCHREGGKNAVKTNNKVRGINRN